MERLTGRGRGGRGRKRDREVNVIPWDRGM